MVEISGSLVKTASRLFDAHRRQIYVATDHLFAALLLVQWLAGVLAALWLTPTAWDGERATLHPNVLAALLLGGAIVSVPVYLATFRSGLAVTRHAVAIGQMLMSALLIHLSGGRIETHFHVFGSLAFLAFYRDWRVLVTATVVVAADHFLRGVYWPQSVFGTVTASSWRWLEHAGWVGFEVFFLIRACRLSVDEMWRIAERRAAVEKLNQDIECKVVERTAQLMASERRFRSLAACSPTGIFHLDEVGNCIYANDRSLELSGVSEFHELSHLFSEQPQYAAAIVERVEFTCEMQKDERWLNCKIRPIDGHSEGFVGVLEDVTARKNSHRILEEARLVAERASRAKSDFLATMSHELRTPMNAIIGFSEMLIDQTFGPLNAKQTRYVNNILTSGRHLLALINDILDLAKVEAGKMELDVRAFELQGVLADTQTIVRGLAARKNIDLSIGGPSDVRHIVLADTARVKQILYNLLSNAIKFTPAGGRVEVRAEQRVDKVQISVRDNGIGIGVEDQERVFREFEQVSSSYAREQQGTGLGLALTRQLVELHGGRIWVESEQGRGSTFHFTLPLEPLADAPSQPGGRPVVLMIEVDAATRDALSVHLLANGYDVELAEARESVLDTVRHLRPYAITLDLGCAAAYDRLRELKCCEDTATIPLVIVSASDEEDVAVALGAVEFLRKPVSGASLAQALERLTGRGQHGPMSILVVDDLPVMREMVSELLTANGFSVRTASDGEEAVRMASQWQPRAIVLDLSMPRVSGFEVLDRLRDRADTARIPVLVFTGCDLSLAERERLRDVAGITSKSASKDLLVSLERLRDGSGDGCGGHACGQRSGGG